MIRSIAKDMMIWMGVLGLVMFLGSLVLVWQLIVRMPVDYLSRDPRNARLLARHPVVRAALIILKNACGLCLVTAGVVMLVTPGQGVLCILLGLTLLDIPGRHRLVCRLLSRPRLMRALNQIRQRAHRPPLELPE